MYVDEDEKFKLPSKIPDWINKMKTSTPPCASAKKTGGQEEKINEMKSVLVTA